MPKLINIEKFQDAGFEEKMVLLEKGGSEIIKELGELVEQRDRMHSVSLVDLINEIVVSSAKIVTCNSEMFILLGRFESATTLTINLDNYKMLSVDEMQELGFTPKRMQTYLETKKRFIDRIERTHNLLNMASELTVNLYLEWLYLIYLDLYAVFHVNDYKKIRKLASTLVSASTSIVGSISGVSTVVGVSGLVNDIKNLILVFNKKYLSKSYFDELDSELQKFEKQKKMLNDISDIQMRILKSLTLLVAYYEYDDRNED